MKYIIQAKKRRRRQIRLERLRNWEKRENSKQKEQMALDELEDQKRLLQEEEAANLNVVTARDKTEKEETKGKKETSVNSEAVQQAAYAAAILGFIVPPMKEDAVRIVDGKIVFSEEEQKIREMLYAKLAEFEANGETLKVKILTQELEKRDELVDKLKKEIEIATKERRQRQHKEKPLTEEDMAELYKPVDWSKEITVANGKVQISEREEALQELVNQRLFELEQDGKIEEHEKLLQFVNERNKPLREAETKMLDMGEKDSIRSQLHTAAEQAGVGAPMPQRATSKNAIILASRGLNGPN